MKGIFQTAFLIAAMTLVAHGGGMGFDPIAQPEKAREIYLAPMNSVIWRMRQPDGSFRAFEKVIGSDGLFRAASGWRGRRKGDQFVVNSGANEPGGPYRLTFLSGRLARLECPGRTNEFAVGSARPRLPPAASPLLDYMDSAPQDPKAIAMAAEGKWAKSGRLRFPYGNPNKSGAFYAILALFSLMLLALRSRKAQVAGCLASVLFVGLLLATGSRGALVGFAVGLLPVLCFRGRRLVRSRRFWIVACVMLAVVGTAVFAFRPRMLTRGFGEGKKGWSNRIRTELWAAAPKMMADAPDGWGFCGAGPAYVNWYQPYEKICFTGTLMNDHLNRMVEWGRIGRCGYVFGILAVLWLLAVAAKKTDEAAPLGAALAFVVAMWFNPISREADLWVLSLLPVLCLAVFHRRRLPRGRGVLLALALAAVSSAAAMGGLYSHGLRTKAVRPSVRAKGTRVMVGGSSPSTWVVDDGQALGGILFGKDLRALYRANSWVPAIGYVSDIGDLPAHVSRLALAGGAGDAWLRKISADEAARRDLPQEVVFISPPFPPQAIPPPLLQSCRVRVIVGEFACWYSRDYDDPPAWVTIVPGAERYIPHWLGLVFQ